MVILLLKRQTSSPQLEHVPMKLAKKYLDTKHKVQILAQQFHVHFVRTECAFLAWVPQRITINVMKLITYAKGELHRDRKRGF